jgi:hypothetical protein
VAGDSHLQLRNLLTFAHQLPGCLRCQRVLRLERIGCGDSGRKRGARRGVRSGRSGFTAQLFSIRKRHVVCEQGKVCAFFLFIADRVRGRRILRSLRQRSYVGAGRVRTTGIGGRDRAPVRMGRGRLGRPSSLRCQLPLLLKQCCLDLRSGFTLGLLNIFLKVADLLGVHRNQIRQ